MNENSEKYKTIKNTTNEETIESNNKSIKTNGNTVSNRSEDMNTIKDMTQELVDMDNKGNEGKGCKVCGSDEDMSTQFFASGPFYALDSAEEEQLTRDIDNTTDSTHRTERSDKCNVLYAEMPQMLGSDMNLGHNQSADHKKQRLEVEGMCCGSGSPHPVVEHNYQFVCYNCCSPLSVGEDSQLNHNLYYLSNDESKARLNVRPSDEQRSSLSSPIMLKFCRESVEHIDHNSTKDESNGCNSSERLSNYTTVIKPKAVRPKFSGNGTQVTADSNSYDIRSHLMRSTLPTLSFHGSTNVLTDRDDSAFTQIPRRRSNSEATHHYQSISNDSNRRMPSRSSIDYSRPLLRSERSKSVNKTYNSLDTNLDFSKCQAISDKHLTKTRTNNTNNVYFSRNFIQKSSHFNENLSKQMTSEPIHMTLEEVRNIFTKNQSKRLKKTLFVPKYKRNSTEFEDRSILCKSKSKSKIKCAFESLFRTKRKSCSPLPSNEQNSIEFEDMDRDLNESNLSNHCSTESTSPFTHRALPPLPNNENESENRDESNGEDERQKFLDYAASIERVKDCGWYWGPISGEMAEKLLASEPCGSFIVRDSSDEHYIFSLTFKLNGLVRHVRIEHDQGNFSFGSLQKFRSNTIVDFIENAVQHSRSGRFLFFLHRRPVMGPMRVQLLHPVSRFKQIQSLQHMCRFIILKHVRRDLIKELPLPQMLISYLNTPYYYSEELALMSKEEPNPGLDQSLPPN